MGKLEYRDKNIYKDLFIDKYEKFDIIKNYEEFIKKIEELKSYIIEFEEKDIINNKIYLPDYVVSGKNCQSFVLTTYNKCTLFINNGI